MKRNKVRLTESQLQNAIKQSVLQVLRETDYHRAYKAGKNLDVLNCTGGVYLEGDIVRCLVGLKTRLRQAKERSKMPQFGDEGKQINYLVGAIRGLEAFIDYRRQLGDDTF